MLQRHIDDSVSAFRKIKEQNPDLTAEDSQAVLISAKLAELTETLFDLAVGRGART